MIYTTQIGKTFDSSKIVMSTCDVWCDKCDTENMGRVKEDGLVKFFCEKCKAE